MENKLLMKLLIGSEAVFFLCLIVAFIHFNYIGYTHPVQHARPDIKSAAVYTLVLIFSSGTYWAAERLYKRGWRILPMLSLGFTILLGCIFLYGQATEYLHLLNANITMSSGSFGSSFFTLTGFHGLHVFIGVVALVTIWLLSIKGDFKNGGSTVYATVGIYWHFVDAVWLILFGIIYVLPLFMHGNI